MKKNWLALLLAGVLCFNLTGCQSNDNTDSDNSTQSVSNTSKTTEAYLDANSDTTDYWVEERYLKDSDVVPYEVHVFGKTDTANFRVFLRNIEERPTVEFLTSFSVVPYTE